MVIFLISSLVLSTVMMDKPAYQLFNKEGETTSYKNLLKSAKEADVVLFGELHNNPICHWLQLELSKDMHASLGEKLLLGAEMFEADNQLIVEEYLAGLITDKHLENEAKVWNNFKTDYKPLLDFAKANQLSFVASNIPRRYASLVSKKGLEGLEALPAEAKQYIAPLPLEVDLSLPAYANMISMMGGSAHGSMGKMKPEYFAQAQAIKDATMAHFILKNHKEGQTLLHFNGAYHSDNFESIVWYLKKQQPKLKIMTITSIEQENVNKLLEDHLNKADFILTIPTSMTKTY